MMPGGQQRGARRRTDRRAGIELGEPNAMRGKTVEGRCPDRPAIATKVPPTQVVGQTNHHVRSRRELSGQDRHASESDERQEQGGLHRPRLGHPVRVTLFATAKTPNRSTSTSRPWTARSLPLRWIRRRDTPKSTWVRSNPRCRPSAPPIDRIGPSPWGVWPMSASDELRASPKMWGT